ncbi:MAG: hypothetical protein ACYC2G_08415, partial [Gemmatimonadaceae bacterium]
MTDSPRTAARASCSSLLARSGRFGWVALLAGFVVATSLLARIAIVLSGHGWHGGPIRPLLAALATGTVYDALVALWLAAPLLLYLVLLPQASFGRRTHRVLRRAWIAAALFGALFVAVAEVVFFAEFDGRFNFVAVDYLVYPTEVVA